jgi:predicted GNAT family N-acyltransferase
MIQILEIQSTDVLMQLAYALRREVFVDEQNVPPELEIDEHDEIATHLVASSDGNVVGTLRIVREGSVATIGRMAVSQTMRNTGLGTRLMMCAARIASGWGADVLVLNAQLTARGFYKRLGYVEEGDVFQDANIPHIQMRKRLSTGVI